MKVLCAALLLGFLVIEGQSGSSSSRQLAPDFSQVRQFTEATEKFHSRSLRIATWNIDDGANLPKIVSALEREPAALYLFQEVDLHTARAAGQDVTAELARRLHLNGCFATEFEELSQGRGHPAYIGQATLTRLPVRAPRIWRAAVPARSKCASSMKCSPTRTITRGARPFSWAAILTLNTCRRSFCTNSKPPIFEARSRNVSSDS